MTGRATCATTAFLLVFVPSVSHSDAPVSPRTALVQILYTNPVTKRCESGTGFFVDARRKLFITAAHVLEAGNFDGFQRQIWYVPKGTQVPKPMSAKDSEKEEVQWRSGQLDMAIVALPESAPEPAAEFSLAEGLAPADLNSKPVTVPGFPGVGCKYPFQDVTPRPTLALQRDTFTAHRGLEEFLHADGEERTTLSMYGEAPQPGHSGAPLVRLGTMTAVGMVRGAPVFEGGFPDWSHPLASVFGDLRPGTAKADAVLPLQKFNLSLLAALRGPDETVQPLPVTISPSLAAALPRAPAARDNETVRELVTSLGDTFAQTYLCQWMGVGARATNRICNGPCDMGAVSRIYATPIAQLGARVVGAVCAAIDEEVASVGGRLNVHVKCGTSTKWFIDNGHRTLGSILTPMLAGPGQKDALFDAVRAQVSLIKEIFVERLDGSPAERDEIINRLLERWLLGSGPDAQASIHRSENAWATLQASCGVRGCRTPFGMTSQTSWRSMVGTIFREWLEYFSSLPNTVAFWNPGCAKARMSRGDDGLWTYYDDRTCRLDLLFSGRCLSFPPPRNTAVAASAFADHFSLAPR